MRLLTYPFRFTVYDFGSSKRMSYYPHNQPVVALGTQSDNTDRTLAPSASATIIPTATVVERSLAGSPMLGSDERHTLPSIIPVSRNQHVAL